MSQSHDLQLHITQLEEIRAILNSMKNLAFMEIHKLTRYQSMQSQAVVNIENAAMDFLDFYPKLPIELGSAKHIYILVGSERGFCGDFNESLIITIADKPHSGIIAVGGRLGDRLSSDNNPPAVAIIPGANIAEEVPAVLTELINTINSLKEMNNLTSVGQAEIRLTVVYHGSISGCITLRQILPPFPRQQQRKPSYGYPPLINLDVAEFYSDLVHHYLFAVLHEILYISLMAENHSRLQHLEGAVKHLDDVTVNLHRKIQIYRQEEITEEIEVILLNSENP